MNTTPATPHPGDPTGNSLLKLQLGPVQDFIAQARSTRDLWSGSYLLSWLMASAIAQLRKDCPSADIIYPIVQGQPLCELHARKKLLPDGADPARFLIPSLPNLLLAEVPAAGAAALAKNIDEAIRKEWTSIAEAVWNYVADGLDPSLKTIFDSQIGKFLSVSWQVTPGRNGEDWTSWVDRNGHDLAAVRMTRNFGAWAEGRWTIGSSNEKDSLTGREEGIVFGDFETRAPELVFRFKHKDTLGAVTLVKRLWDLAYLEREWGLSPLPMPNTQGVARHTPMKDSSESDPKEPDTEPYFAVLAFDGDEMGKWASAEKRRPGDEDKPVEQLTKAFSEALKCFALKKVEPIVGEHAGRLIYAGGDDILALLPADTVLACAKALREAFRSPQVLGPAADASVGIAIAHQCAPLQDVVRAAQDAEHRAKNKFGRSAVAVTIFKRSGEITEWGFNWDDGGFEFYQKLGTALDGKRFSAKFPHRFIELLSRYKIATSPLIAEAPVMVDTAGFADQFKEIVLLEFRHVASRQSADGPAAEACIQSFCNATNTGILDQFLEKLACPTASARPNLTVQEKLARITNLLTATAFHQRIKSETPPPAP